MPRKRLIPKKKLQPDPIYNSVSVTRFTNMIMSDGKKSAAEKVELLKEAGIHIIPNPSEMGSKMKEVIEKHL